MTDAKIVDFPAPVNLSQASMPAQSGPAHAGPQNDLRDFAFGTRSAVVAPVSGNVREQLQLETLSSGAGAAIAEIMRQAFGGEAGIAMGYTGHTARTVQLEVLPVVANFVQQAARDRGLDLTQFPGLSVNQKAA